MSGAYQPGPIRGLPGPLPQGERLLWQGSPRFGALARRALHVRKLAVYVAALLVWRAGSAVADGEPLASAVASALWLAPLALAAVGLPALLAWLIARTTVYTITNRRVAMRIGVALPMTVNIPFRIIDSAALRADADGTGDIPLALAGAGRIAWLHLWPHARPWRLARPEPMLRAVPDAARVADILGRALDSAARPAATPEAERPRPVEAAAA